MLSNEVLRIGGPDYFLAHPPRQPKKEIGDYVESQGILVPKRFATLSDALSSGKPFIVRSEHPQDYAGASNIFGSYKITQEALDNAKNSPQSTEIDWSLYRTGSVSDRWDVEDQVISQVGAVTQEQLENNLRRIDRFNLSRYFKSTNIPLEEFSVETSYSYWELLPGNNRTIVVDSAVPGRYHIFTSVFRVKKDGSNKLGCGYTIAEDNKIVTDASWLLPPNLLSTIPSLIQFYESVRNLGYFNPNHCPIMEVQTVGDEHYFLQYHRSRDAQASSFVIDREPIEGEMLATFVRGVTPKEGLTLTVNFHTSYDKKLWVKKEDAGLDFIPFYLGRELMSRKRHLVITQADDMWTIAELVNGGHVKISELFKSPISLALRGDDINLLVRGFFGSKDTPVDHFDVHVVSDGKKAYIKRLD